MICIHVLNLSGEEVKIDCSYDDPVKVIKKQICSLWGIPEMFQDLIFESDPLNDNTPIESIAGNQEMIQLTVLVTMVKVEEVLSRPGNKVLGLQSLRRLGSNSPKYNDMIANMALPLLNDQYKGVRLEAAMTLCQVAGTGNINAIEAVCQFIERDPENYAHITELLDNVGELGDPAVITKLQEGSNHHHPLVRNVALRLLAQFSTGDDIFDAARKMIDEDVNLKNQIFALSIISMCINDGKIILNVGDARVVKLTHSCIRQQLAQNDHEYFLADSKLFHHFIAYFDKDALHSLALLLEDASLKIRGQAVVCLRLIARSGRYELIEQLTSRLNHDRLGVRLSALEILLECAETQFDGSFDVRIGGLQALRYVVEHGCGNIISEGRIALETYTNSFLVDDAFSAMQESIEYMCETGNASEVHVLELVSSILKSDRINLTPGDKRILLFILSCSTSVLKHHPLMHSELLLQLAELLDDRGVCDIASLLEHESNAVRNFSEDCLHAIAKHGRQDLVVGQVTWRLQHSMFEVRTSALHALIGLVEKAEIVQMAHDLIEDCRIPEFSFKCRVFRIISEVLDKGDVQVVPLACACAAEGSKDLCLVVLALIAKVAIRGDRNTAAEIVPLLCSEDVVVRMFALQAYVLIIQGDDMLADLQKHIEAETDDTVLIGALTGIHRMQVEACLSNEQLVSFACAFIRSGIGTERVSWQVIVRALEILKLARKGDADALAAAKLSAGKHTHPAVKETALAVLSQVAEKRDEQAVSLATACSNDEDMRVRGEAVKLLGATASAQDARAVAAIRNALHDEAVNVRVAAGSAAESMGITQQCHIA